MVNAPSAATVTTRRLIAEDTFELKLRISEPFSFRPGQYIELNLPDLPADPPFRVREFSLVSTPTDPELTIAFRHSSTIYKQALLDPAYDGRLHLRGPHGIFTLPNPITQPIVMIAGGIGIAPFISMLRDLRNRNLTPVVTLLRLESSPKRLAYKSDLQELTEANPHLAVIEQFGRLQTSSQLATLIPHLSPDYQVYIAGPLGMTGQTRTLIRELNIPPLSIHLEEFSGYPAYYEAS